MTDEILTRESNAPRNAMLSYLGAALFATTVAVGAHSQTAEAGELSDPVTLRIATFEPGSAFYSYGATVGEILRGRLPSGSSTQVLPFAGGGGNPTVVQNGDADMAFSFSANAKWAYEGLLSYASEGPHDRLRSLVGGLDHYHVGVVVRRDVEADSLGDVVDNEIGLRLHTLPIGSAGEMFARLLLEAHGASYDDLNNWGGAVTHTSFDVIQSDFQDGNTDAVIHVFPEGHPAITQITVQNDTRILNLTDAAMAYLSDEYGLSAVPIPAGAFRGQPDTVQTVGFGTNVIVPVETDDALAYELTKAFIEERDRLVRAHPAMEVFDIDRAAAPELLGVPLHPGARRYYDEVGIATGE